MAPRHILVLILVLALVPVLVLAPGIAGAQGAPEAPPPETVLRAREAAEAASAPVLSPDTYAAAVVALERARRAAAGGDDPGKVAAAFAEAERLFRVATSGTRLAGDTFAEVIRAREAARAAEAWRWVPERWKAAEEEFTAAARRLEKEDLAGARKRGSEALARYDTAELQALLTRYLAPPRAAILAAEEARAERLAPRTLTRARDFLARAEATLAANRRDPDQAADLIEAATREGNHAARVAELVRSADKGDRTTEDIILGYEATIAGLAEAAGIPAKPLAGDEAAAASLVNAVGTLRRRAESAERELGERNRQVAGLEEEIRELDDRLGGTAAERDRLVMAMEAQRRAREQIAQVQALFDPKEGEVIRQGDGVVLRLTGLNFASGSARLGAGSQRLLAKVEQAIGLFPGASFVVEGHTDNTGGTVANQRLSEQRADAVAQALVKSLKLAPGRVSSVGLGESRPVANNETAAGKARNRRIDIVITPATPLP